MPEGTYRDLTFKELKDLKNIIRLQEESQKNKVSCLYFFVLIVLRTFFNFFN